MNVWQATLLLLLLLAQFGCRTDPSIALLERELRMQEDTIYELEHKLERCQRGLANCERAPGTSLEPRPSGPRGSRPRTEAATEREFPSPQLHVEPSASAPGPDRDDEQLPPGVPRDIRPPTVENPTDALPEGQLPSTLPGFDRSQPLEEAPPFRPQGAPSEAPGAPRGFPDPEIVPPSPDRQSPQASQGMSSVSRVDSREVQAISLSRMATGGFNADNRPGDEGIVVVVEPRDAEGRLVDAPAPVSIAVLDPTLQGDDARIARWDFTTEEMAALFRNTPLVQGNYLEMVWPSGAPSNENLQLFVRYLTSDGRKLESTRPIRVHLADLAARRTGPAPSTPEHTEARTATLPSDALDRAAAAREPRRLPARQAPQDPAPVPESASPDQLEAPRWAPYRESL